MEGDPYCSNCGTIFSWDDDDEESSDDYDDYDYDDEESEPDDYDFYDYWPFMGGKNMWECEYCGEMNDDDAIECEYCGLSPDVNYGWLGETYGWF